ncbi:MAG: cation:proton antiporter [Bacillota bacterium]
MGLSVLLAIGIILVAAVVGGRAASYLKLPLVVGYLFAGILIGPWVLGLVDLVMEERLAVIAEMALALIAFSIGAEFRWSHIKKLGTQVMVITVVQAVAATGLVFIAVLVFCRQSVPLAITMGAISAATAPAATIMVVRQYKAKGPVTEMLLPVVALDDAICILFFSFAMAVAQRYLHMAGEATLLWEILLPFWEIGGSVLFGTLSGLLLHYVLRFEKTEDNTLIICLGAIFTTAALAAVLHFSALLTSMVAGTVITNLRQSKRTFHLIDGFTPPIYAAFFTLAGASLHLNLLAQVGMMGVVYVLARGLGKVAGAGVGAKLTSAEPTVVRYLGFALLPQAGVAIGLASLARIMLPEIGATLSTSVLAGVVVYEFLGPILAKWALAQAGEIPAELLRSPLKPQAGDEMSIEK